MGTYFLEMDSGPDRGRKVELGRVLVLGRSPSCGLRFSGEEAGLVSGEHAVLENADRQLRIRDLGSRNGTYVNGQAVKEATLSHQDVVSLGAKGPRLVVLEGKAGGPEQATTFIAETQGQAGAGERTLLLARRLRQNLLAREDLARLVRNAARVERMVVQGLLPGGAAQLLSSAARTYAGGRRKAILALGLLAAASAIAVSVLGYQNLQYRGKLEEQKALLARIRTLESRLDNMSPGQAGEKGRLVRELGRAGARLMALRSEIRTDDRINAYAHPLGAEIHALLEEMGKKGFVVPESFIELVQAHVDRFRTPPLRATVEIALARKERYYSLVVRELEGRRLPPAFFYLAMQESLLDPLAVSPAKARGLWQFMPRTARAYDLVVPEGWESLPPEADQRTDVFLSTRAAAHYLHRLYSELGDAPLAMAAYNAGGGRLRRVLRRIEDPVADRDFWYIYNMGLLPEETAEYVPKILALVLIDRNRDRYGFGPSPAGT